MKIGELVVRRGDLPRKGEIMRKVRVTSMTREQVVGNGVGCVVVREGDSEHWIYEADIPQLQALVEDPARIARAREQLELNKEHFLRERGKGATWESVEHAYDGPRAWHGEYQRMFHADPRPFLLVQVTEDVKEPESTPEEKHLEMLTSRIAGILASAMGAAKTKER